MVITPTHTRALTLLLRGQTLAASRILLPHTALSVVLVAGVAGKRYEDYSLPYKTIADYSTAIGCVAIPIRTKLSTLAEKTLHTCSPHLCFKSLRWRCLQCVYTV